MFRSVLCFIVLATGKRPGPALVIQYSIIHIAKAFATFVMHRLKQEPSCRYGKPTVLCLSPHACR